ncbi:hypothetical protein VUR80DRAFT_1402 [Thermomyces stellatus]
MVSTRRSRLQAREGLPAASDQSDAGSSQETMQPAGDDTSELSQLGTATPDLPEEGNLDLDSRELEREQRAIEERIATLQKIKQLKEQESELRQFLEKGSTHHCQEYQHFYQEV